MDKDRGRIGLTLAGKLDGEQEITPEELIEVAEADPGAGAARRPASRWRRRPRPRRPPLALMRLAPAGNRRRQP